jgi:hypothetical protein
MAHAMAHVLWLFGHLVEVSKHFAENAPLPGFSDGH